MNPDIFSSNGGRIATGTSAIIGDCDRFEFVREMLRRGESNDGLLRFYTSHIDRCPTGRHSIRGLEKELGFPEDALRDGSPARGIIPNEALAKQIISQASSYLPRKQGLFSHERPARELPGRLLSLILRVAARIDASAGIKLIVFLLAAIGSISAAVVLLHEQIWWSLLFGVMSYLLFRILRLPNILGTEHLLWVRPHRFLFLFLTFGTPVFAVSTVAATVTWFSNSELSLLLSLVLLSLLTAVALRAMWILDRRKRWCMRELALRDTFGIRSNISKAHVEESARFSAVAQTEPNYLDGGLIGSSLELIKLWLAASRLGRQQGISQLLDRLIPRQFRTAADLRAVCKLKCRVLYRLGRFKSVVRLAQEGNAPVEIAGWHPSDVLISYEAMALFKLNRVVEAFAALSRSKNCNSNGYLLLNRSFLSWQCGFDRQSRRLNNQVRKIDEKCPLALRNEAYALIERVAVQVRRRRRRDNHALSEAYALLIAAAEEALERVGYIPAACLHAMGTLCAVRGEYGSARRLFSQGIRLEDHAMCRLGLAVLAMCESERLRRAEYKLRKVLETAHPAERVGRVASVLLCWVEWAQRNERAFSREVIWWSIGAGLEGWGEEPPDTVTIPRSHVRDETKIRVRWIDHLVESREDWEYLYRGRLSDWPPEAT